MDKKDLNITLTFTHPTLPKIGRALLRYLIMREIKIKCIEIKKNENGIQNGQSVEMQFDTIRKLLE